MEAGALKRALTSSSGVRGSLGEMILQQILEDAGLVKGTGFDTQVHLPGLEDADFRPDFVIYLPNGQKLVVDSKEIAGEYLLAHETEDPDKRKEHFQKLAQNIRTNFMKLGKKEYQTRLTEQSIPFVIMFISNDNAFRAAVSEDPALYRDAHQKKVILVTPFTIIPLIQLISQSWLQFQVASNARELGNFVEELGNRLSTFVSHVAGMRDGIEKSAESWDKAVGSWERMVAPQLEKVKSLGGKLKDSKELNPINAKLRTPSLPLENPRLEDTR
jgi:DNA recombination protein RmuC